MVLPSQCSILDQILNNSPRKIGKRDWANSWCPMIICYHEAPWKILAQGDQGIRHFLCKLPKWTEFTNGRGDQNLNWGDESLDGNGEDMSIRSFKNYLGFFLATKMVVPLESPQNAILVLNRKMQFIPFNYYQYFCESSIWSPRIPPQVFITSGDGWTLLWI